MWFWRIMWAKVSPKDENTYQIQLQLKLCQNYKLSWVIFVQVKHQKKASNQTSKAYCNLVIYVEQTTPNQLLKLYHINVCVCFPTKPNQPTILTVVTPRKTAGINKIQTANHQKHRLQGQRRGFLWANGPDEAWRNPSMKPRLSRDGTGHLIEGFVALCLKACFKTCSSRLHFFED